MSLSFLDLTVLLGYLALVMLIGIIVHKSATPKSLEGFYLGGRRIPWWAAMISVYATSLSALTFIGVPGAAFSGDFNYLQLGIGDLVGRCLVAWLLIRAYYRAKVVSVYQLLGQTFGPRSQDMGAGLFIATRILASGVRLAGCAIGLAVIFQIPVLTTIWVMTLVALLYTAFGGIKAVIWTDFLQFCLFILAASLTLFVVTSSLPGGWGDFIHIGNMAEKFKVFHVSFDPSSRDYWLSFSNPKSLLAGFLFGALTTLAVLGTDQDLVQRLLTCSSAKDGQKAMLMTALLNLPITLLFLSVGASLYVYFQVFPDQAVTAMAASHQADRIFPYFIREVLGTGIRGLVVAGLFAAAMSSLDSALNALASSAQVDFFSRYRWNLFSDGTQEASILTSRLLIVGFAFILGFVAMGFSATDSILWLGFRVMGYTYGGLLAAFLLAIFSRRTGGDWSVAIAAVSSIFVVIAMTSEGAVFGDLRQWFFGSSLAVAWPWSMVIGMAWTMTWGYLGLVFRGRRVMKQVPDSLGLSQNYSETRT